MPRICRSPAAAQEDSTSLSFQVLADCWIHCVYQRIPSSPTYLTDVVATLRLRKKNDLWHSVLSISKALSDFCLLLALSKKLIELKNATFHHLSFRSLTLSVSLDPQQSKPTTHYPETNVTEQYM